MVGCRQGAAGTVERLHQRHRYIVDRHQARRAHLTVDVDTLAAVRLHMQRDVGPGDVTGQLAGQGLTRLVFGQAAQFDGAGIGKLHRAAMIDHKRSRRWCAGKRCGGVVTRGAADAERAGTASAEFGMVPDHDRQHVATVNGVRMTGSHQGREMMVVLLLDGLAFLLHQLCRDGYDHRILCSLRCNRDLPACKMQTRCHCRTCRQQQR